MKPSGQCQGCEAILPVTTTPISKMKPTLDSIASAKAKLAEELRQLEQQEESLRKEQAEDAFAQVIGLLTNSARSLTRSSGLKSRRWSRQRFVRPRRRRLPSPRCSPSIGCRTPAKRGPVAAVRRGPSPPGRARPPTASGRRSTLKRSSRSSLADDAPAAPAHTPLIACVSGKARAMPELGHACLRRFLSAAIPQPTGPGARSRHWRASELLEVPT